ncbi:hypothetical protein EON65_25845 [archaeon]|nr:MAG: hypothetical protein EON65_25845 [archaeon]
MVVFFCDDLLDMPRRKPRSRSQGDLDEGDVIFFRKNELSSLEEGAKKLSISSNLEPEEESSLFDEATSSSDGKKQLDLFYGKRDYGGGS